MSDPYDDDIDALIEAGIAGDFDPLDRDDPDSLIGAHVVNWRTLDPETAPAEWETLREWVEWFTVRYNIPLSTVPDCWWQHGTLVEELSALHTAHVAAFDPSDGGFGPIGWHERLTIAIPRLGKAYPGSCRNGHIDTTTRTWAGKTDETAWAQWAADPHGHAH